MTVRHPDPLNLNHLARETTFAFYRERDAHALTSSQIARVKIISLPSRCRNAFTCPD